MQNELSHYKYNKIKKMIFEIGYIFGVDGIKKRTGYKLSEIYSAVKRLRQTGQRFVLLFTDRENDFIAREYYKRTKIETIGCYIARSRESISNQLLKLGIRRTRPNIQKFEYPEYATKEEIQELKVVSGVGCENCNGSGCAVCCYKGWFVPTFDQKQVIRWKNKRKEYTRNAKNRRRNEKHKSVRFDI